MPLPSDSDSSGKHLHPRKIITSRLLWATLLLIAVIWLLEPFVDVFVLGNYPSFIEQLLNPHEGDLYIHSIISVLVVIVALIYSLTLFRLNRQKLQLSQEHEKLRQVIEFEPECVKTVSEDGTVLYMNPAGLAMVEANSLDEVKGLSVYDLIAPEYRQKFIDFNARIFAGESCHLEFDIMSLKGSRKTLESHAVPLLDNQGKITAHLSITRDITQSRELADKLTYQNSHDMLTGLINRFEFERRLENARTLAITDKSSHAIFFVDLDQFKMINDSGGHIAGDHVLKQAAAIMLENLREQDSVARLSGDEFAILMQYCSTDETLEIAKKVRTAIEAADYHWGDQSFKITASIGVVIVDQYAQSANHLLRDADTACYIAKDRGRNKVYLHQASDAEIHRHKDDALRISKIYQGIEENHFFLFAETIAPSANSGEKNSVEILLRHIDSNNTITPPGDFFLAAERYGIAPKLDRYVIESCLGFLSKNKSLLDNYHLFCINLSALSLNDDEFLSFIHEQFKNHSALAKRICFEITETAAIRHLDKAQNLISTLRDLGCKFSLDDFGSGLSSFGYLKNLSVDFLKIDGSFVRDITKDPINRSIVKSINDIGQLMGKKTIAEFVEDDESRDILINIGVDYVQGHGVAKSIPIEALLDENRCAS